jgi:DNA-binding LacI/PurR family transcriptional regulator
MIAYDDFEFASMLQTPLTVVRQPIADMVQAAMASLFRQIDGDTSPKAQTVAIAGELVVRSSCGCG